MMTHVERFKRSIDRKTFDRIPISLDVTSEMMDDLKGFLNQDENTIRYKIFDIDRMIICPEYISTGGCSQH